MALTELASNEFFRLAQTISKKVVTRGGKILLESSDLADYPFPTIPWTEITGATNATVNRGYIANNISQVVITLPTTMVVGSMIAVTGKGAGGWSIKSNTGQVIHHGAFSTISGGYLRTVYFKDSVQLICITANTDWSVVWTNGNLEMEVS